MRVIKRNGESEDVSFDKISSRLRRLSQDPAAGPPLDAIDVTVVAQKTCAAVYDNITTSEIDSLSAEVAVAMGTTHPQYQTLAARIAISNLHKQTQAATLPTFAQLFEAQNQEGKPTQLLGTQTWELIKEHHALFDSWLDWSQDYTYNFFAVKTMENMYLTKVKGVIIERPQHMILRVALGIWGAELDRVKETYTNMSQKFFTHATPTLFNSGMKNPQLSSCFLLGIEATQESVAGIYDVIGKCAQISKGGGGIGLHLHDVRSRGSLIRGTNGRTAGLIPLLKVINETARYIDQAGRRPGAIAIYLEPSHPDIFQFLDIRKSSGDEGERCRDLFPALWISDLFMKRVEQQGVWSLMDPVTCPGLSDCWGEEYERLYEKYEAQKLFKRQVPAQELWFAILTSIQETSLPYMLMKDAANGKSNQQGESFSYPIQFCTFPQVFKVPQRLVVGVMKALHDLFRLCEIIISTWYDVIQMYASAACFFSKQLPAHAFYKLSLNMSFEV